RAEACWRDFWQFLRCITYGIAGANLNYLAAEGLENMELLYQELKVPLLAMVTGLENLKYFSLQEFPTTERVAIAPYFDKLIAEMKQFK
ncbi:MAG: phycobilisome protein, partial [Prochloraceae cyanobacterium]|nr:phycobilisome protein [Prochloraceae cyanobacterium]